MRPCQSCGRPANFRRPVPKKYKGAKTRKPTIGRDDHDLCQRCWHAFMESLRAETLPND